MVRQLDVGVKEGVFCWVCEIPVSHYSPVQTAQLVCCRQTYTHCSVRFPSFATVSSVYWTAFSNKMNELRLLITKLRLGVIISFSQ